MNKILCIVSIFGLSLGLFGCKDSIETACANEADDPANRRMVSAMVGGRSEFIKACVEGAKAYDMK